MKNKVTAGLALFASLLFVYWISGLHFFSPTISSKALFENGGPDDQGGSSQYDLYRLMDPRTGQIPVNFRENELAFAATLPQRDESRSVQWQNRGPYNLGGRTRALAIDVTNENNILAGQVTGGMWRSTDGGQNFTECTQPGQIHSCTCVTQDTRPGYTNTWYYGTGEEYAVVNGDGFSSQFSGNGIFKSVDSGVTWTQLQSTVSNTPQDLYGKRNFDFVWNIVVDTINKAQDIVYAAVVNGIWRSTDGGSSWTAVLGLDTTKVNISLYTAIAITGTGVLYATISSETPSGGVWRSTDGINWVKITPATFASSYSRTEIGICPGDQNLVYLVTSTGETSNSLYSYRYLSGDGSGTGGVSTKLTGNLPNLHCRSCIIINGVLYDYEAYNTQEGYDMYVGWYPSDTTLMFLGGTNLYRSHDAFTSPAFDWIGGYRCDTGAFVDYRYPNHHPDQHKLVFFPSNPQKALSGNDGGVMETDNILADTVVWTKLNNGYNTGQFYTCAIEPGNTNSQFVVGGLQDNGTYFTGTNDFTVNWPLVCSGDGAYCAITHGRNYYYLSSQEGRIYKEQIDGSGNVQAETRIDPPGNPGYNFVDPFILDPFDDNIMYLAGSQYIYRNDSLSAIPFTENYCTTITNYWSTLTGSSIGTPNYSFYISALNISEANTNRLYYGTSTGQVYRLDSCKTSTTSKPVNISDSIFPSGGYVSCVAPDRLNANELMVVFSNYNVISLFYSTDSGSTFTNVSGNLEENPDGSGNGPSVTWANIYNDGITKKYYVGTSIGLFSTDTLNGLNTAWVQEGPSTIGNVIVNMITSRAYDGNVVVATHGAGIFSNQIFSPTAVNNLAKNEMKINCYPNPFNNSIVIDMGAGMNGEAEADIFDMGGKLIRKLKSKNVTQIVWDGNDFSNATAAQGTYLVKVSANGKNAVSKVVKL